MKRAVFILLLVVCVAAHADDLRVRLFSAMPPTEIEIVPQAATMRTCPACKALPLDGPLKFVATAQLVHYGKINAPVLLIEGTYRLRATGALTVDLDAPLEIHAVDGRLRIVARLPMERYVALALGGEAGGIKSPEALKAIAVAIRTYAARFRARHQDQGFDVCDSTHCQVLRLSDTNPAWTAAAEDTAGELLWYDGALAYAYHHASCGGTLEDGRIMVGRSVPYLRRQADDVCTVSHSDWDTQLDKSDIRRALKQAGFRLGSGDGVTVTDRDRSGRARRLLVDGAPVDATSFRMAIGRELGWNKVRSELYEVSDQGESVIFHGRGRGHGVGLCQTGAELRGTQGANYREILSFYYPGTTLGVTVQGLDWIRMTGERIELQTTSEQDKWLIAAAERLLRESERRVGWKLDDKPQLRVYPTVATFRDSTGEPGWVAASSIGRVIRLQPASVLRAKDTLDATLRHELLHMLIESKAREGVPLWFREGLVLHLANSPTSARTAPTVNTTALEERFQHPKNVHDLKRAYAEAAERVATLVKKHGESVVLAWVKSGLPAEVSR